MAISWTAEQEQVIKLRDRGILVSAAAGSGKTAVLIERILERITDENDPVDITDMLIVTFTRAAASEMKERLRKGLDELFDKNPTERIRLQRALLPQANIQTFDSFCAEVVRSCYYKIDLDPGFRITDEAEMALLRADILQALLEDEFENGTSEELRPLASALGVSYDLTKLGDAILKVADTAEKTPWPDLWLAHAADVYDLPDDGALEKMPVIRRLVADVRRDAEEAYEHYENVIRCASMPGGPAAYPDKLASEMNAIRRLREAESFAEAQAILSGFDYVKLMPPRKDVDPLVIDKARDERNAARELIEKTWKKQVFARTPGEIRAELREDAARARELVRLAVRFRQMLEEEKRRRGVREFSDLEHDAIRILSDGEGPDAEPSAEACEYRERFREILIDEYQDSNDVQETLIGLISRERINRPNVFMVGDVKQSIYAFRNAKPGLFLDKYRRYTREESRHQKIELFQNFRSRAQVLDSVNYLFAQLMQPDIGGIEYDVSAALHPAATFAESEENVGGRTELLLCDPGGESLTDLEPGAEEAGPEEPADGMELPDGEEEESSDERTAAEWEAAMIARRIQNLLDPVHGQTVWDAKEKGYRPACGGDIVILLRSFKGYAETFVRVLTARGIPAVASSRSGYFAAWEVQVMINFLRLIDNPLQDIPLASVLRSPIIGMSSAELAELKTGFKDGGLCDAFRAIGGVPEEEQTPVMKKAARLQAMLAELRSDAAVLPVRELLHKVFRATGFYDTVTAMPGGAARRANLDMLVMKAADFEKTSYTGLFQFTRYIERLRKVDIDFGEASLAEQADKTVRIMTIHGSKGLEFPIVFVSGLGKKFNRMDQRAAVLTDDELGIAFARIDERERVRGRSFLKDVIASKIERDMLGEEMRLLYVAMTRAKEKLILTGFVEGADEWVGKHLVNRRDLPLPRAGRQSAGCLLDWVGQAYLRHRSADELRALAGAPPFLAADVYQGVKWLVVPWEGLRMAVVTGADLVRHEQAGRRDREGRYHALMAAFAGADGKDAGSWFDTPWRYGPEQDLHAVFSVSEIKKAFAEDEPVPETMPGVQVEAPEERAAAPAAHGPSEGALRGTAMHAFLEHVNLAEAGDVDGQIRRMAEERKLTPDQERLLVRRQLKAFAGSALCRLMKEADENGLLHREWPFVAGFLPQETEMVTEKDAVFTGQRLLVRGIIDAWLEEADGSLTVIDYKTDRVPAEGGDEILIGRYRMQLVFYKRVLEQLTGKTVKECVLWSFALGRTVKVPV